MTKCLDALTIGEAKQIAALFSSTGGGAKATEPEDHGLQIAVLDRGWVYVGKCVTDSQWLTITEAKNVRRWGTTKGLGELAAKGPLTNTELDAAGTVKVALSALKFFVQPEVSKWA